MTPPPPKPVFAALEREAAAWLHEEQVRGCPTGASAASR